MQDSLPRAPAGDGGAAVALLGGEGLFGLGSSNASSVWNEGLMQGGDAGDASANAGAGIAVGPGVRVSQIVNLGQILGGAVGQNRAGIVSAGTVDRLVNAQGGSVAPLTFGGSLPKRYEIVINAPSAYGQLEVFTSPFAPTRAVDVQKMAVSVNTALSQTLPSGTYARVIAGVSADEISNEDVVIDGGHGVVSATSQQSGQALNWDLRVLNYGADMARPQQQLMDRSALILRSDLGRFDCDLFDAKGLCVTGGLRQWGFSNGSGDVSTADNDFSFTLTAATKLSEHFRLGGFLNAGGGSDGYAGTEITSSYPTFGGFIAYSAQASGEGLKARVAGAFKIEDARFTRSNLLGSGSQVTGESSFDTYGIAGELGFGFKVLGNVLLTPYVGFGGSNTRRAAFAESGLESGVIDETFTYDNYNASQATGSGGLRVAGALSDRIGYRLGAGVEYDLSYDIDAFTVQGSFGRSSYAPGAAPNDVRVNGSAGVSYLLAPNRSIGLDGFVTESNYSDAPDYSLMLQFKLGL